jgi:hypothetical protein
MLTFAYAYETFNRVIVTDGTEENSFIYDFGKSQDVEISVIESVRLSELEIAKKQQQTPIAI